MDYIYYSMADTATAGASRGKLNVHIRHWKSLEGTFGLMNH